MTVASSLALFIGIPAFLAAVLGAVVSVRLKRNARAERAANATDKAH